MPTVNCLTNTHLVNAIYRYLRNAHDYRHKQHIAKNYISRATFLILTADRMDLAAVNLVQIGFKKDQVLTNSM